MKQKEPLFKKDRENMVVRQLAGRDITDERVLDAMNAIPRHRFVPEDYQDMAYKDGPLPIGNGQTISQPYIVALMTQLLELEGDETVLEIGTGSGYQAAVLSSLVDRVFSIERHEELAENAREIFLDLGIENIEVIVGDGSLGITDHGDFDGIMVTAASPSVPGPLLDQLKPGGKLVIPVGSRGGQNLERWINEKSGEPVREHIIPVAFVPLIGKHGWQS